MSKKKSVDRRMISVSPDLNARMSKHDEVNWSAVACRAFEAQLGAIAAQKKEKKMEDVIARLRASKLKEESERYSQGKKHGDDWARNRADHAQLKRLARFAEKLANDSKEPDWEDWFQNDERYDVNSAERLAGVLMGNEDAPREKCFWFWEKENDMDSRGADLSDPDFVRGFADGALCIWELVVGEL